MRLSIVITYAVLGSMTAAYSATIWYASNIWSLLIHESGKSAITSLSMFSIAPLPGSLWLSVIHWQLLAIGSFVGAIIWGRSRIRKTENTDAIVLPAVLHTAFILLLVIWHSLGVIAPLLSIGYVIN